MKVNRAHKIRLVPTVRQEVELKKACGVARYTYNWALNAWKERYAAGEKPSAFALKKVWNSCKPSWVYESPKDANQQPFSNLSNAFKKFFRGESKYPAFKKKTSHQSFYMSNDKGKLEGKIFQMARGTRIKLREELRFEGRILSCTISKDGSGWYISVSVETEVQKTKSKSKVGIDLGVKTLATCSDGKTYERAKATEKNAEKLAVLHQGLARKKFRSKNWSKQKLKIQKLQTRIRNQRMDNLHKVTTEITKNHGTICLEDLKVTSMVERKGSKVGGKKSLKWGTKSLTKGILDASFRAFRTITEYKAKEILFVDRYYPSSKTCSSCGTIRKNLSLLDRVFQCPGCNLQIDRDLNASLNILRVAG